MKVIDACSTDVVTATLETSISRIAQIMRDRNVGTVVITSSYGRPTTPIGIVTDRDIVIRVVATGETPSNTNLIDIVAGRLMIAKADDDLFETLSRMRSAAVRRMPVVNADGTLAGLLSVDDVMRKVASTVSDLPAVLRPPAGIHQDMPQAKFFPDAEDPSLWTW